MPVSFCVTARRVPNLWHYWETNLLASHDAGFGPELGSFDWADPFRLVDQLTEDQRMLAEAATNFAQDRLLPRVVAAYAEERVEPEIFAARRNDR